MRRLGLKIKKRGIVSSKIAVAVIVVVVVVVVSAISVLILLRGGGGLPGAPRLAIVGPSGQGSPVLDEGVTAVYSWHSGGSKIGSVTYKGVGGGRVNMTGSYSLIGYNYSVQGYILADSSFRITQMHMVIEGGGVTMTMDFSVDYILNKMNMEVNMLGNQQTVEIVFPPEALEQVSAEDLYIGWSKDYTFQVNGAPQTVTIDVTQRQSVTVPKGTFDCYRVEESGSSYDIVYWITPEGYCPQYSVVMSGYTITCELESYHS
jgi:hypothetical protein